MDISELGKSRGWKATNPATQNAVNFAAGMAVHPEEVEKLKERFLRKKMIHDPDKKPMKKTAFWATEYMKRAFISPANTTVMQGVKIMKPPKATAAAKPNASQLVSPIKSKM